MSDIEEVNEEKKSNDFKINSNSWGVSPSTPLHFSHKINNIEHFLRTSWTKKESFLNSQSS